MVGLVTVGDDVVRGYTAWTPEPLPPGKFHPTVKAMEDFIGRLPTRVRDEHNPTTGLWRLVAEWD